MWKHYVNHLFAKCFLEVSCMKMNEKCFLDIPDRFRWLTAVRSAVVQTSRPHPGKSKDLEKTFGKLFEELIK